MGSFWLIWQTISRNIFLRRANFMRLFLLLWLLANKPFISWKLTHQKAVETSNCYFQIGVFYLQHKFIMKGLACFKRSLQIRRQKYGENNESVADCLYNLALTYKQMNERHKALQLLSQVLEIRRVIQGENSLQVAQTYETIGKVNLEENDFKKAIEKFQQCYAIRK